MANNIPFRYITLHPCQPNPFLDTSTEYQNYPYPYKHIRFSATACSSVAGKARHTIFYTYPYLPAPSRHVSATNRVGSGSFALFVPLTFDNQLNRRSGPEPAFPRPYPRPCTSVAPYHRKPTMWNSDRVPDQKKDQKKQKGIPRPVFITCLLPPFGTPRRLPTISPAAVADRTVPKKKEEGPMHEEDSTGPTEQGGGSRFLAILAALATPLWPVACEAQRGKAVHTVSGGIVL